MSDDLTVPPPTPVDPTTAEAAARAIRKYAPPEQVDEILRTLGLEDW